MADVAGWRRRARLVAGACALVVAVACGGGGGSDKAAAPTAPATTRPVDTSFTGAGSTSFCNLAKSYNERFANVGSSATPAQLRATMEDGKKAINEAVAVAPAEIKSDVQVIATSFSTLADAFAKANYDPTKIDPKALQTLQTPEFQASSQRLQTYLTNVCKVSG